jgi:hypothetical protein
VVFSAGINAAVHGWFNPLSSNLKGQVKRALEMQSVDRTAILCKGYARREMDGKITAEHGPIMQFVFSQWVR